MPGHRGEHDNLLGFHHHDDGRCPAADGGMRSRPAGTRRPGVGSIRDRRPNKSREADRSPIGPQKPRISKIDATHLAARTWYEYRRVLSTSTWTIQPSEGEAIMGFDSEQTAAVRTGTAPRERMMQAIVQDRYGSA